MTTKEEKNQFSQMIEKKAAQTGASHIDTIISHCEETGLEIEVVNGLVNPSLKSKIEAEAKALRYLKGGGGSKLPI